MFGLTFEKLLVIAVLAGLIVGPQNLPAYSQRVGEFLRMLRSYADAARAHAEAAAGAPLRKEDWEALDPRRYDPRRILRDAMTEETGACAEPPPPDHSPTYAVTGSSGHPRRVRAAHVGSTGVDDPTTTSSTPTDA